ncbi:MAG: ABC transporter ATP-binding protein/permease [Cryomorphaceae bacterium]|nr:ABC transporter ATP-binding protein/permease [Cryomorphaceae bacterium]
MDRHRPVDFFRFFHQHLGGKVYITVLFGVLMGILDGLGLLLFLPLLKNLSAGEHSADWIPGWSITTVLLLLLLVFVIKAVIRYTGEIIKVRYQHGFIRDLRIKGIEGFRRMSYLQFVKSDAGRLQNSMGSEINRTNQAFQLFFTTVQWGILAIIAVSIAMVVHPLFTITVLLGGGLLQWMFNRFYRSTKHLSKTLTTQNHKYHRLLIQLINHFTYLKANARVAVYGNQMAQSVKEVEDNQLKLGNIHALISALREPLVLLISIGALLYHHHVRGDEWSLLLGVFVILYRGVQSIVETQSHYNAFLGLSGSLINVDAFLSEIPSAEDNADGQVRANAKGDFAFQQLSYKIGAVKVFSKFEEVVPGQKLTLIKGESGRGKSTLLHLISGLVRPSKGELMIGEDNYANLNIQALQKHIGYITQEPAVFADTLYNNVTFWDEDNEQNRLRFRRALEQAALIHFLDQLPDGADTAIGHQGYNLSGGQRQRLAIARELYRKADVLLFDEPTAALDKANAETIAGTIAHLKKNITIVVATHQPEVFLPHADKIINLS